MAVTGAAGHVLRLGPSGHAARMGATVDGLSSVHVDRS